MTVGDASGGMRVCLSRPRWRFTEEVVMTQLPSWLSTSRCLDLLLTC